MYKKKVTFSYINNSILLSTETITKNGFNEIWRQEDKKTHSIQILVYNEKTFEFKAFDRFHWSDEPIDIPIMGLNHCYKRDLWTPIVLHFTNEWWKKRLN